MLRKYRTLAPDEAKYDSYRGPLDLLAARGELLNNCDRLLLNVAGAVVKEVLQRQLRLGKLTLAGRGAVIVNALEGLRQTNAENATNVKLASLREAEKLDVELGNWAQHSDNQDLQ